MNAISVLACASRRTIGLAAIVVVLLPGTAAAQTPGPPANDNFANATILSSEADVLTGSTVGATVEPGEPAHYSSYKAHSVWFEYTPAADATVTLSACGSAFDTILSVYTGTQVDALTRVANNDDSSCGRPSKLTLGLHAGTRYTIALDGYGGESGAYSLRFGDADPPGNDNRANALYLSDGTYEGSTSSATKEPGEADHAGDPGGHSVWFRYYASTRAAVMVEACGSAFDTVLAVYGDGYGGDQELASNDDSPGCGTGGKASSVRFTPPSIGYYQIALDGHAGASGAYRVSILSNDDRAGARQMYDDGMSGNTAGATKEPGEADHAGDPGGRSVWFRYYAWTRASVVVQACGSDFDTLLAVYGDGYGGDQELASNDNSPGCGTGGTASAVRFTPPSVGYYQIALDGHGGATGAYEIKILTNDDRAGSLYLSDYELTGSTIGTAKELGEADHAGDPGGHSVWFQVYAQTTAPIIVQACGSDFDTVLAAYGAGYGGDQEVGSNDDAPGCGVEARRADCDLRHRRSATTG